MFLRSASSDASLSQSDWKLVGLNWLIIDAPKILISLGFGIYSSDFYEDEQPAAVSRAHAPQNPRRLRRAETFGGQRRGIAQSDRIGFAAVDDLLGTSGCW